jgi:DNA replication protein DnaC
VKTIEQLEAEIDAIGRPATVLAPIAALFANTKAKAVWDAANPEGRAKYFALVGELQELRDEQQAANDKAYASERRLKRLVRAGCGERSAAASEDPRDTPALSAVEEWLQADKTWLLLAGAKGCGKTVAATWAVDHALSSGKSAAFRAVSAVGALSQYDDGATEMERLRGVHLLVLDELGVEFASDYAKSRFFELLDARHEACRPTILTSNLGLADASKRLGERIADRIVGDGSAFELGGASLRRVK